MGQGIRKHRRKIAEQGIDNGRRYRRIKIRGIEFERYGNGKFVNPEGINSGRRIKEQLTERVDRNKRRGTRSRRTSRPDNAAVVGRK